MEIWAHIERPHVRPKCAVPYNPHEHQITSEEFPSTLRVVARHKSPGIGGFGLQFYTANWETIKPDLLEILNQMFLHKKITPRQKHGNMGPYRKTSCETKMRSAIQPT